MSGWISSKIKAAENLLQQIDQQAAESLRKSPSELSLQSSVPFSQSSVPFSNNDIPEPSKDQNPKSINLPKRKSSLSKLLPPKKPLIGTSSGTSSVSLSSTTDKTLDADWTEILNSPSEPIKNDLVLHNSTVKREKEKQLEIQPIKINESFDKEKKLNYSESGSDSDSDSDLSYDSEEERERLEERARKAIEEREEVVGRLQREKDGLEKILLEREKEQAVLVRELQDNTSETIEAVEMEKKKHYSTRMEALDRVAKLEGVNAELSKELARVQRNLDMEVNKVAKLREQIELKETSRKEFRRKIYKIQSKPPLREEISSLKRFKLEIFEAEYSFVSDKIAKLKDKAKSIEENINIIKREMESHSEMETEMEKRLDQLTDRLIQKQMQVESLASEKATLLLRIEMVSRSLDDSFDIEEGTSKKPSTRHEVTTGRLQLGSIIHQLDSLFSAGLVFLKRNPKAQIWALIYVVCLHVWFVYIFMSSSEVSEGTDVISLASINRTLSS